MSEMQTVLAECLDMERGISKEVTGKEHLERTDFIIAKQKQEAEQAKAARQAAIAAKEEAEAELLSVEGESKAKERYRLSLDSEIAEKEKQLKDERKAKVDSILDSVGSLVGVGKSAAVEKGNARLKAENERMKKAFAKAVKDKAEERTKANEVGQLKRGHTNGTLYRNPNRRIPVRDILHSVTPRYQGEMIGTRTLGFRIPNIYQANSIRSVSYRIAFGINRNDKRGAVSCLSQEGVSKFRYTLFSYPTEKQR